MKSIPTRIAIRTSEVPRSGWSMTRMAAEYVLLVWLARRLRSTIAWSEDRRET